MVIPKAKARCGFRNRIVVDKSPYCGKTYYHSLGSSDDDYQRLADCFKGEYILTFGQNIYIIDGITREVNLGD